MQKRQSFLIKSKVPDPESSFDRTNDRGAGGSALFVERTTHVRYFLIFWLFILSAVAFLDRTNISIAGVQMSREYALGNQRLGWIFSAFLIGYAGFQLPAGALAASVGPRRVLTFGVIWWGVATALTASLQSGMPHLVIWLVLIRFALGAGESVIYPAANQFVARWVPRQERGIANGMIFAGVGAGSGLTPPLLMWIITENGWRSAFWFSATVGLAVGMVWWLFARDTPEDHPGVSRSELRVIHSGLRETQYEKSDPSNKKRFSLEILFSRSDLAALMIGYFSFGYVAWVFFSWFFVYMNQVRGFDMKASARYSMLPFLCMTVFSLVGGWLSDRLTQRFGLKTGRCYLAMFSLLITAVFLACGSTIKSPQAAALILAGGAGALYVSQSTFWAVSVDIAGLSSGFFSSAVNMGGQIGGALTASLTPWIATKYGWRRSFMVAASFAVIGALSWLFVNPDVSLEGS
jgi:MFS transporter, ACS family, glucarate transporter